MIAAMESRGPDRAAVETFDTVHLGCARLAIRGGARGDQPLKAGRVRLVFNGEIYNSDELVKDLAQHGVEVSGESDTEIVGWLLSVYGLRALDRLNGMFALAWYDGRSLFLARDPAGVKPLYYRGNEFASTIEPLLDDRRALNADAVARWLTFHVGYGEETFFEGVLRVPAGGVIEMPEGILHRASAPGFVFSAPNPALTEERLAKVLQRAVRDASPRTGRYGVALSGGIDSTLVAALAEGDRVAYHGHVAHEGCDESAYARAAAQEIGIPLVEVPITAEGCWRVLPDVVRALEEPVAGPGSMAQYLVAERAAQDVRVLLSGCGGDELFGGYARSRWSTTRRRPDGRTTNRSSRGLAACNPESAPMSCSSAVGELSLRRRFSRPTPRLAMRSSRRSRSASSTRLRRRRGPSSASCCRGCYRSRIALRWRTRSRVAFRCSIGGS